MSTDKIFSRPVRVTSQVEKWHPGRTPEDGPPDEIVTEVGWLDVDGSEIIDAKRIDFLASERELEKETR